MKFFSLAANQTVFSAQAYNTTEALRGVLNADCTTLVAVET